MKNFHPPELYPLISTFLSQHGMPKIAKRLAKHCSLDDDNPLLALDLHSIVKQHIAADKDLRKKYKKFKKTHSLEPQTTKKRKESE